MALERIIEFKSQIDQLASKKARLQGNLVLLNPDPLADPNFTTYNQTLIERGGSFAGRFSLDSNNLDLFIEAIDKTGKYRVNIQEKAIPTIDGRISNLTQAIQSEAEEGRRQLEQLRARRVTTAQVIAQSGLNEALLGQIDTSIASLETQLNEITAPQTPQEVTPEEITTELVEITGESVITGSVELTTEIAEEPNPSEPLLATELAVSEPDPTLVSELNQLRAQRPEVQALAQRSPIYQEHLDKADARIAELEEVLGRNSSEVE